MKRPPRPLPGLVMLLLAAALMMPPHRASQANASEAPVPPNWQSHWAAPALGTLLELGFVTPEATQAGPEAPLPRGAISTWVAQAAGLKPFRPLHPTFRDLSEEIPWFPWVEALVQTGAVQGYPDGSFGPERSITRAEVAAILVHFENRFPIRHGRVDFTDTRGHWAEAVVQEAARREILLGYPDGSFRPDAPITYAEGVTLIHRFLLGSEAVSPRALALADQIEALRQQGGLVTTGEMASVLAQNYFAAPPGISPEAALALLRRNGLPVSQPAGAYLLHDELQAWVAALDQQGLLAELDALDQNPGLRPQDFLLDLQLVRAVRRGLFPLPRWLQPGAPGARDSSSAGPSAGTPSPGCFANLGIAKSGATEPRDGIPREQALMVQPHHTNRRPIAAFTVRSPVQVGEPVTYEDHSFDPDGDPLERLWAGRQSTFHQPGYHTVTLTVVDPTGAAATASREIQVLPLANRPPVARFAAPDYVLVGEPIAYQNRSTDPDGDPLVAEDWDGRQERFDSPGEYPVTLRVQDSRGAWSHPYHRIITVRERPENSPVVQVSPNPVRRGESVTVTLDCATTAYKVWVDVPPALERGPVRFGDGEVLVVENPDQWAAGGSGSTWRVQLTVPWTQDRPPDGTYPLRFTVYHKDRWSWIHTHEEEVCTEPMEGSEPVCWIETERHRHWETDYWETHHTAELMVRGTVQVIQPGRTGP